MNPLIIGVSGGTASGKSTFTNNLKERFGERVVVMYHDNYYKDRSNVSPTQRENLNYDCPDAFDTDLLIKDLAKLKKGEIIESPLYNFSSHCRLKEKIKILPREIIILEGILVLYEESLRDLMDIKIFMDAESDERILRRILRDTKERSRTVESIVNQYRSTVKSMHEFYIEPTKKHADIIITSAYNKMALNMIYAKINEHIISSISGT